MVDKKRDQKIKTERQNCEWIKKMWSIIYNGILLSHQKWWILIFWISVDGTGGDYAEWTKSSRESQLSYGFNYLWNIRNNMEDISREKEKWIGGNQRGVEPWETEKQTEGFGGEGVGGMCESGGRY